MCSLLITKKTNKQTTRQEETFGVEGSVSYLDAGDGFMGRGISLNLPSCIH